MPSNCGTYAVRAIRKLSTGHSDANRFLKIKPHIFYKIYILSLKLFFAKNSSHSSIAFCTAHLKLNIYLQKIGMAFMLRILSWSIAGGRKILEYPPKASHISISIYSSMKAQKILENILIIVKDTFLHQMHSNIWCQWNWSKKKIVAQHCVIQKFTWSIL